MAGYCLVIDISMGLGMDDGRGFQIASKRSWTYGSLAIDTSWRNGTEEGWGGRGGGEGLSGR